MSAGSLTPCSLLSIPSPSTVRGVATKLGASPDGSSISYGSGRTAVIRALQQQGGEGRSQLFGGHAANVTVVKIISPYYAASGDAAGNVKVWDTTGNQSLKFDSKPITRINDLACDAEGKRLIVVGEGKSAWGAAFSLDTGSSIGEVAGHSKVVNAVGMRPGRPFKAVTGSDDFSTVLLNGVPFKYGTTSRRHTRFVQSVDYAPTGALYTSAGSDGQVFLYDGTTGEDKGALVDSELGDAAHKAGVFAASFSRDGTQVATSSADQRVKLWDVEGGKVVQTWEFAGDSLQQQQVGNVFAGSSLVSLSFSGDLNILDPRSSTPISTLYGHQNPITALAVDEKSRTFFSGDSAGRVLATSEEGVSRVVDGQGHAGLVVGIRKSGEGFWSAGFDDTVRKLSPEAGFDSSSVSTGGQPKGLAASTSSSLLYLATASSLTVLQATTKLSTLALSSPATTVAASADGSVVVVATEDLKATVYDAQDPKELKKVKEIELRSQATAAVFSEDGKYLALGLSTGKVPLYNTTDFSLIHSRWTDTTARVHSLAFNSSSSHLAAASLDESIRIYSVAKPSAVISAKNAHRGGVSSIAWKGDSQLVSAGADGALKTFEVKLA